MHVASRSGTSPARLRRHEPQATLPSVCTFLDAWAACTSVVASTPLDTAATAALRDAYLLRVTSEMAEGVAGYACDADTRHDVETQLMYVLAWMDTLDRLWAARLTSRVLTLGDAQAGAHAVYPTPAHADRIRAKLTSSDELDEQSKDVGGRPSADMPRYSQTDRVRLRDELLRAREQLFAWMRQQLGMPLPPTVEDASPTTGARPRKEWGPEQEPEQGPEQEATEPLANDADNEREAGTPPAKDADNKQDAGKLPASHAGTKHANDEDTDGPVVGGRLAAPGVSDHYAQLFEKKVRAVD